MPREKNKLSALGFHGLGQDDIAMGLDFGCKSLTPARGLGSFAIPATVELTRWVWAHFTQSP